jgi:hypothetical protein
VITVWLGVGVPLIIAAAGVVVLVRTGLARRWEARAERARIDREVRKAERRLHNLASDAFGSMLATARRSHDKPG